MSDEFGVDLAEVQKVVDSAEVLVVRFHLIDKRLLIDFRTRPGTPPLIMVVPRAESVEERVKMLRKLRPELPATYNIMSFLWPRTIPVLLAAGVWQRIVDRVSALGNDDTTDQCGRVMEELLSLERAEVQGAIWGADHYQTLWERRRA